MKKRIDSRIMNEEIRRVQNIAKARGVSVEDLHVKTHQYDESITLGVNWSSRGAVTIEEAQEFVNQLQNAIDAVKTFKYQGLEPCYEWQEEELKKLEELN